MEEDIAIINSNTRKDKIKNFLITNKKKLILLTIIIIISFITLFVFQDFQKKRKIEISNQYNSLIIEYSGENKNKTIDGLIKIIEKKDSTYSPLALYFIIDNSLIKEKEKINELFDILINKTKIDKEIKDLIIYKKATFNSNFSTENDLLKILNPLVNSESIWKSHALYLLAEFFYYNNQKQKAKEFYNKIINLSDVNSDILVEAQKRLSRDYR